MKIELKPLSMQDVDIIYGMFQSMPEYENGVNNLAYGMTKPEFANWVQQQINNSKGIDLPDGYVPATTYVLYIDGTPVGRSNIRHSLNDYLRTDGGHIGLAIAPKYRGHGYGNILLQESLKKAKEMGIKEILVFNHDDNISAWKMSEKNGGKLASTTLNEQKNVKIRKYIFDIRETIKK